MQETKSSPLDLSAIEADKLYDGEQAGELIGTTEKTLANQRNARKGPAFIKLGQRVFYRGRDLLEHIERSRVDPNAPLKLPRKGSARRRERAVA